MASHFVQRLIDAPIEEFTFGGLKGSAIWNDRVYLVAHDGVDQSLALRGETCLVTCPVEVMRHVIASLPWNLVERLNTWNYGDEGETRILGEAHVPWTPEGTVSLEMDATGTPFKEFLKTLDDHYPMSYSAKAYFRTQLRVQTLPNGEVVHGTIRAQAKGEFCHLLDTQVEWMTQRKDQCWRLNSIGFTPIEPLRWYAPVAGETWGKPEREQVSLEWEMCDRVEA